MNFNNAKMMRYTERILKRLTVYQENRELGGSYELFYLLVMDGNEKDALAYAVNADEAISFNPFAENPDQSVKQYDSTLLFNDNSLFNHLEDGYRLVGMLPDAHYCVWDCLSAEDMETDYPDGLKKYMQFCRQNGVTMEKMIENGYDGTDILAAFKQKNIGSQSFER